MSKTYAVPPAAPQNHGKTVAAWVMFAGVVIGAVVVALGLVMAHPVVMGIGAALIVVTIIVSAVLRGAGLGQKHRDSGIPQK